MDKIVEKELALFEKEGITQESLDATWEHCKQKKDFLRFKIIQSTVYGKDSPIKRLLEALVQKYPVPDVDFIYFNEDRLKPSVFARSAFRKCAPIFVSAKHRSLNRAILFSDWVYDIQNHESGWNFFIQTLKKTPVSWEEKIDKLFWRGTPWDGKHFGMYTFENWKTFPRGNLVFQSKERPDLIDAAFSQYPDKCRESLALCEKIFGKIAFVSWAETFRFKYQMAIDGVTCSFPATQWKLLSGSLTFLQESPDIMYFYDALVAWEHYIPVRSDLSDLTEKIAWAKTHDAEAKRIAQNGREFAITHLMPEHILEYCYKVLCKYASLQKFTPHE